MKRPFWIAFLVTLFVGIGIGPGVQQWLGRGSTADGPAFTESATQAKSADVVSAPPAAGDLLEFNRAFVSLAERLSPTVVNIHTTTRLPRAQPRPGIPDDFFDFFFGNPFGRPGPRGRALPPESQALGSGFIINADEGYIVTNSHVVSVGERIADEIRVSLIGGDAGEGYLADVVGVDPLTDVALIKLREKQADLKAAALGNSDLAQVGEWVLAIGNPYGHTHSVTQGIVSALSRDLEGLGTEFIQTSASINPGNSGGPLFNLNGEVIGINTAIDPRAQGIGFAIPVNVAKVVIEQLISKGRVTRGWLGIGILTVTPEVAAALNLEEARGVLVREVVKGGPADRAGLLPNDVILEVNNREIDSQEELAQIVGRIPIGDKAEVEIMRGGNRRSVEVEIGESRLSEGVQS